MLKLLYDRASQGSNDFRTWTDPVFCRPDDKEWFFWDESWSNIIGPYDTEREARAALDAYIKTL